MSTTTFFYFKLQTRFVYDPYMIDQKNKTKRNKSNSFVTVGTRVNQSQKYSMYCVIKKE